MTTTIEPDETSPPAGGSLHWATLDEFRSVAPEAELHDLAAPSLAPVRQLELRERIYRRFLALADGGAALLTVLLAGIWHHGVSLTAAAVLVVPFAVLIAKIEGLYDRDDQVIAKTGVTEWRVILQSSVISAIGCYLAWPVITTGRESHGIRLFAFLVLVGFITTVTLRAAARALARRNSPVERCVIVGDRSATQGLAGRLSATPGVTVIGQIPEDSLTGLTAELSEVINALALHRLVIAPSTEANAPTLHLIRAAKMLGVRVTLVPNVMTAVGGFALIEELDGLTLLGVPRFGLTRSSMALKRIFDLCVGSVALVLAAPLLVIMALAIKLDSPGPVIFRQSRVGRSGRLFPILKFRTMVEGADQMKASLLAMNEAGDGLFKMIDDPRITRVGRLMRATHLDELPKLINVLRGEMSLVGPRPLVAEEDAQVTGRDRQRLKLTPGMTGPWQVKGPLNAQLSEMAMLDYRYASDWSIWRDVDIILATAARVLSRGGH